LDAHRVDALQYVISGPQPISIRDQMLRGAIMVFRLLEAKLIAANRPLVVAGAGAGGATAAMLAADLGLPAILVERGVAGFLTQSLATARWLDPTQYDWPLDHHHHARFPWNILHSRLPLRFGSAWASALSQIWRSTLDAYVAQGTVNMHSGRTIADVLVKENTRTNRPEDRALEIRLDDGTTLHAGAAIMAKGFGFEKCRLSDPLAAPLEYEGQPFWGPDSFDRLRPADHAVLISGSGDGGLQDYLRIVTHLRSAAEIAAKCKIPPYILHAVQSAEDRAMRGRSWAQAAHHEGAYFWELEQTHRQQVAAALTLPTVLTGLHSTVPVLPVRTNIVYREPYITSYYGLNRFLTLLISEFIVNRDSWQTLFPGVTIDSIAADGADQHDCVVNGRAAGTYDQATQMLLVHDCFERWHQVRFNGSGAPQAGRYNVVIVRHGLLDAPRPPIERPRHLLPYHLP
jgi:hypothetical protein